MRGNEMNNTADRIREIETELAGLPTGYISRKLIRGKERFYLQWTENGKMKSKYIKDAEYAEIAAQVEKRKEPERNETLHTGKLI